ncbi:MAG: D-alanyl-D-alanine carboxypeptidase [Candidatus Blackburnbacteria bacterium]|nr:D-alanyl-D-alanine carboxypeptidase [Candidatus Blackburnbacteria bacterium]
MPKKLVNYFSAEDQFLFYVCAFWVSVVFAGLVIGETGKVKAEREVLPPQPFVQEVPRVPKPDLRSGAILPPVLSAKAVYVVDDESGEVLFSKNESEPVLPASTTKIATALVALTHYNLQDVLTVGKLDATGQTMDLQVGEEMSVENLLYGLLIFSANDAAEVLAQNYPGGRSNFIDAMNRLAKQQGLENTHFVNPVGFDEYLHFSSAQDLTKLAQYAIKNPVFAKIVATPEFSATNVDGTAVHKLANINELIGKVPGVLGIKTGWTESAGESLITLIERDGHKVVISLLGSADRFEETKVLLDWIFGSYEWK